MVRTLLRRAETIVTEEEDRTQESEHVRKALSANGYKPWSLKLPKKKEKVSDPDQVEKSQARKFPVSIPYIQGLSEKLQRVFRQHGVATYHKPFNSLRSLLVQPKDKTENSKKCGVVYNLTCDQCPKSYVGETARALGTRFKEHTDGKHPNSAVWEHIAASGHSYSLDKVKVLAREENSYARKIREALHIHKTQPALNRDRGLEIPPTILQLMSCDRRGHVTHL